MANVRIGDLTFQGGGGQDGFYIRGEGLGGLLDGVDVRRDSVDRPNADGVFSASTYLTPRVVVIGGDCVAGSAEKLDHYASRLKVLQATRGEFRVVFDMPGKTLWGDAHLSDRPTFVPTIWGVLAEWDIELQFDDPRLFGESRTFTTGSGLNMPVHHYGNADASPVLTVSGTMPSGYTLTGGGESYTVTRAVVAGSPHVIDLSTGFLSIAGVVQSGGITAADVWTVPGGAPVIHRLQPTSGTGTLTVSITDTYL